MEKESISKGYKLPDSIHVTFVNSLTSDCQESRRGERKMSVTKRGDARESYTIAHLSVLITVVVTPSDTSHRGLELIYTHRPK